MSSQEGLLDEEWFKTFSRLLKDPSRLQQLFLLYFQDFEVALDLLKKEQDPKKRYEYIHKMKGSSGNVGAKKVRTLCMAYEEKMEKGSHEQDFESFLQDLSSTYWNTKAEIQRRYFQTS